MNSLFSIVNFVGGNQGWIRVLASLCSRVSLLGTDWHRILQTSIWGHVDTSDSHIADEEKQQQFVVLIYDEDNRKDGMRLVEWTSKSWRGAIQPTKSHTIIYASVRCCDRTVTASFTFSWSRPGFVLKSNIDNNSEFSISSNIPVILPAKSGYRV